MWCPKTPHRLFSSLKRKTQLFNGSDWHLPNQQSQPTKYYVISNVAEHEKRIIYDIF